MIHRVSILLITGFLLLLSGCSTGDTEEETLFELMQTQRTGIAFKNELTYTNELNPYTYRNFYNGGGVGLGDFNRDGWVDIFFTGNQVGNRLYLNEGDFRFRDITEKAGLRSEGVWSTGVSVADVNGDGWLDIYVCKSGPPDAPDRQNQLFMNNGDGTFTDQAATYGIDLVGLATDATFFDYDRDGDLDMYLLNHSFSPVSEAAMRTGARSEPDPKGGDRLFRNERIPTGDPTAAFTDVTSRAGIFSSAIGFGLDLLVGDVNRDGWPDIYISNDYFERDYLYLNNRDGTFSERLTGSMKSISLSSMGGDVADLTRDGNPEIYVTDMLPENPARQKRATAFDFWDDYRNRIDRGYHYQFVRNTLQLNRGSLGGDFRKDDGKVQPVYFSEIGRLANVFATDWSWSALITDLNQDGKSDIYVTNGIYKDLTYQDYVTDNRNLNKLRSVFRGGEQVDILFDDIPSTPVANYVFSLAGELEYENKAEAWGLAQPGFSNGAAYGDLDNDGDLDLVVNNVNDEAFVYKNRADTLMPDNRWLQVELEGERPNTSAIGAQVTIWTANTMHYREQMPNRGFQSSVDHRLHFGLGQISRIDSLKVLWPDGGISLVRDLGVNRKIVLEQAEAGITQSKPGGDGAPLGPVGRLVDITERVQLDYMHMENSFVDFSRNRLLFHMRSTDGPAACAADVNGDGLGDLYLGGAKDQSGAIYIQRPGLVFEKTAGELFAADRLSEDTDCTWFDADGDGNMDLYVSSGGSEFPASSSAIADRLYFGEGSETWRKAERALPPAVISPTSTVDTADYDRDGDIDLFVGRRLKSFAYGMPVKSAILKNDGSGVFSTISGELNTDMLQTGPVTDARWVDYDRDGDWDLIIAGEWMPLRIIRNNLAESGKAAFEDVTSLVGLDSTNGWWQSVELSDLNEDGYLDIIAGNQGKNSIFKASRTNPLSMFVGDFDENGIMEQIVGLQQTAGTVPLVLRQDLMNRWPSLQQRFPTFESYSEATIEDLLDGRGLNSAMRLEIFDLRNSVFWNREGKQFEQQALPVEAQFSPVYGILADTGANLLYLGGNLYGVKPQAGRYDASYGTTIDVGNSETFTVRPHSRSGFTVEGEIRSILKLKSEHDSLYLVIRNDDRPVWLSPTQ